MPRLFWFQNSTLLRLDPKLDPSQQWLSPLQWWGKVYFGLQNWDLIYRLHFFPYIASSRELDCHFLAKSCSNSSEKLSPLKPSINLAGFFKENLENGPFLGLPHKKYALLYDWDVELVPSRLGRVRPWSEKREKLPSKIGMKRYKNPSFQWLCGDWITFALIEIIWQAFSHSHPFFGRQACHYLWLSFLANPRSERKEMVKQSIFGN